MFILQKLKGKRLDDIGRASSMVWMCIGEKVNVTIRGAVYERNEIAIHLQCPWRIEDIKSKRILSAYEDIFISKDDGIMMDDCKWEERGSNCFDETMKNFIVTDEPLIVKRAFLTDFNDLILEISDGYIFKTFIDSSMESEEWRIIDNKERKHYVCYGEEICIE